MQLRNHGNVQSVLQIGAELTTNASLLVQAQLMGYAVLQYVAGNRWNELGAAERESLLALCFRLLEQFTTSSTAAAQQDDTARMGAISYALRSKCSVLFALVIKRHGAAYTNESLRRLIQDAVAMEHQNGPGSRQHVEESLSIYQSIVCMIFRYLGDEVYQFAGDMTGDHARDMLASMASWIPEILRFTESVIERNYKIYIRDNKQNKNAHFAVKSALENSILFAEVAPASSMHASGLIKAAGYFIIQNVEEFKSLGSLVLRNVGLRKQTSDEKTENFTLAMQEVGMFLSNIASQLLSNNPEDRLGFEGEDEEFGFEVLDAMVALGKTHLLLAFPDDASRFAFLQQMLSFAKLSYLPLAEKSLELWVKLLQDSAVAATAASSSHERNVLPSEAVLVLMQLAAEQLQQRHSRVPQIDDEIPIFFDDFEEYKDFMVGYRLKLSSIVRSAAATLPEQALQTTVERLNEALNLAKVHHVDKASIENCRAVFEAAALFSESTVKAVWEAVNAKDLTEEARGARRQAFCASIEPVYSAAIQLRVSDPKVLTSLARALGSFSRLLTLRPVLAQDAISNLLDILVNCIPLTPGEGETPPPLPSVVWREGAHARSAIAAVFLDYCKFCQEGFLPHVESIAGKVTQLYESGRLRPGERNSIVEGLVIACTAGTIDQQETVINWSLASIKSSWMSSSAQQTISTVQNFVATYLPVYMEGNEVRVGGAKERYTLYHHLHMIERLLKRLTIESSREILAKHMEWVVPFAFQLLSCLNGLQTQQGRSLMGAASAAIDMSPQEKAHYLRKGPIRMHSTPGDSDAGDYSTVGGATVASARAWIRHQLEFVCHALGLLPSVVPTALSFPGLSDPMASSIFSNLDSIDHKHLRIILRHVMVPFVKSCPEPYIHSWVIPPLSVLAPHMKERLAKAWQTLNLEVSESLSSFHTTHQGAAATSSQAVTDEDVIHDRIVRELSQEYAELLKEIAARQLEEQSGFGQQKMTLLQKFLMADPTGGIVAAGAAVEGMLRPDEAAYKFAAFCRALVCLAPADAALYNYVGSEILYNGISSLSLEVMSIHQAEILGMIRSIIVQQIEDPQSQVHTVLTMLPGVGPTQIASFVSSMKSTGSEKEQRNHVKQFLLNSAGTGSFAALANWKPPGGATAVQGIKQRGSRAKKTPQQAEADDVLQGEITRHLFDST